MATLTALRSVIDAGEIAEREGTSSFGWSIKELVYKEGEDYVWAQFDTREPKPGVAGFKTFQDLVKNDQTYYPTGVTYWHLCPNTPSFGTGNKFFSVWLCNQCERWRQEEKSV